MLLYQYPLPNSTSPACDTSLKIQYNYFDKMFVPKKAKVSSIEATIMKTKTRHLSFILTGDTGLKLNIFFKISHSKSKYTLPSPRIELRNSRTNAFTHLVDWKIWSLKHNLPVDETAAYHARLNSPRLLFSAVAAEAVKGLLSCFIKMKARGHNDRNAVILSAKMGKIVRMEIM